MCGNRRLSQFTRELASFQCRPEQGGKLPVGLALLTLDTSGGVLCAARQSRPRAGYEAPDIRLAPQEADEELVRFPTISTRCFYWNTRPFPIRSILCSVQSEDLRSSDFVTCTGLISGTLLRVIVPSTVSYEYPLTAAMFAPNRCVLTPEIHRAAPLGNRGISAKSPATCTSRVVTVLSGSSLSWFCYDDAGGCCRFVGSLRCRLQS